MNFKKNVQLVLRDFTIILSNTLIFTTIFIFAFSIKLIDPSLLWQIILISGLAALFDLIYYYEGRIDRWSLLIKMLIHFVLIYSLYMSSAYIFHWFRVGDTSFIIWFSLFLVIGYTVAFLFIKFSEKKQAIQINEKLHEYKHKRSDKHE
jgi:hypothetical protein